MKNKFNLLFNLMFGISFLGSSFLLDKSSPQSDELHSKSELLKELKSEVDVLNIAEKTHEERAFEIFETMKDVTTDSNSNDLKTLISKVQGFVNKKSIFCLKNDSKENCKLKKEELERSLLFNRDFYDCAFSIREEKNEAGK